MEVFRKAYLTSSKYHFSGAITLKGHEGSVSCVAVSPDARLAISASYDKTLKVWDVETGRELRTLKGHIYGVKRVALNANGQLAISSAGEDYDSGSGELKLWDVVNGRELRSFIGHRAFIHSVNLSANGRLAFSTSADSTLKIWDTTTGEIISTFTNSAPLRCCIITPDGKKIVTGDEIGAVHFLEWIGKGETPTPVESDMQEIKQFHKGIETQSNRLPRWLRWVLGRRDNYLL
jgi:WD40 repeat protein